MVLVNQPFLLLFVLQLENGYALRSSKLKQRNNNNSNNNKKCLICIHTDTVTNILRQSMAMYAHSYSSMPTGVSAERLNPDGFPLRSFVFCSEILRKLHAWRGEVPDLPNCRSYRLCLLERIRQSTAINGTNSSIVLPSSS